MKIRKKSFEPDFPWMKRLAVWTIPAALIGLSAVAVVPATATAQEAGAPLRLSLAKGGTATLYLPEVDTQSGTEITARSAISVSASKGAVPVFGAVRFTSQATVDGKGDRALLSQIRINEVRLPDKAGDAAAMEEDLNAALDGVVWTTDSKRLRQETTATSGGSSSAFSTKPPKIYYEEIPSVLVFIDGDPILKPTKDGRFKYVENTAYFIVYSPTDKCYYMKGGKWWYRSTDIRKNWIQVSAPPEAVLQVSSTVFNAQDQEADQNIANLESPPKIVVTTEPAELIMVNGAPQFTSIEGTSLLYVDNTETNVVMDVNTQKYYVLLAGRWYASPSLSKGPWTFVPPDRLPGDFAAIPGDSGAADVRASVPGTSEAEDAELAAAIPEVAAVDRNSATVSVTYDGTPSFVTIAGTKVRYAANANVTVLQINSRFYVVDKGIWFESALPSGPWTVAVAVPPEVQDIPPSSPVYNVRYVYIYDYTPDVVYVGYTPGYYCSYVDDGIVVFGTGYYYRPWYGHVYYSYPATFGFGVHYNPYTGLWGYPVGVSYGWIGFGLGVSFGLAVAPFGFWGPAGYMYGYRHGYYYHERHGYYHGYQNGYRDGYTAGRTSGWRASPHGRPMQSSLYADRGTSIRHMSDRRQTLSSSSYSRFGKKRTSLHGSSFQTHERGNREFGRAESRTDRPFSNNPTLKNAESPKAQSGRGSAFSSNPSTRAGAKPSSKQNAPSINRSSNRMQPYNHVVQSSANRTPAGKSSPQKATSTQTWTKIKKVERNDNDKPQKNAFSTFGKKEQSSGFHFNNRSDSRRPSSPSASPSRGPAPSTHRNSGPSFSGGSGRKRH